MYNVFKITKCCKRKGGVFKEMLIKYKQMMQCSMFYINMDDVKICKTSKNSKYFKYQDFRFVINNINNSAMA